MEKSFDLLTQSAVFLAAGAFRTALPLIKATTGYAVESAHPCHPKLILMLLNEGVLHGDWRAKYANAFFKMSRSSRSCVTSLRSRFNSS